MIPLPGLMHLSDELMMNLNRYPYDVQSFIFKKMVNIDTKMLNVLQNWGSHGITWQSSTTNVSQMPFP